MLDYRRHQTRAKRSNQAPIKAMLLKDKMTRSKLVVKIIRHRMISTCCFCPILSKVKLRCQMRRQRYADIVDQSINMSFNIYRRQSNAMLPTCYQSDQMLPDEKLHVVDSCVESPRSQIVDFLAHIIQKEIFCVFVASKSNQHRFLPTCFVLLLPYEGDRISLPSVREQKKSFYRKCGFRSR